MVDVIIVGAGFAGAVSANLLATRHNKKVLVIEKRAHIGGNCYDEIDENGILIHRYGPHLFHTSSKEVWEYLSEFTQWQPYEHKVLAHIDGKNAPIPFNLNTLYQLFPQEYARVLEEKLLKNYQINTKIPILELKKSSDKDLQELANFIYEKIFVNYTAKQWGLKPEELESSVTARVPIFIGRDNRYFNDIFQAVPKEGYTKLFENLLDHPNIQVETNVDFKKHFSIKEDAIGFKNDFTCKVIYTGAIDELFNFRFGELPYRSVDMCFETVDKPYFQEATTINYPNDHAFTRITEFKHIHPITTQKTTILKEYPQAHIPHQTIPYYPIFTDENQMRYKQYADYVKNFQNIVLLGRLAEYKYYDMDDIVEKVLETII